MVNNSSSKKTKAIHAPGALELLLTLALLTACAYPAVYMFCTSSPKTKGSQAKYTAVLLAHHVMESIIAKKLINPEYVPDIIPSEKVAQTGEFFKLLNSPNEPSKAAYSRLAKALNGFEYRVDTYYLEENVYKIIVYVTYQLDGNEMSIFFERLLPQESDAMRQSQNEAENE